MHRVTLYFIAYFPILLPRAVKLCEVPPAKSSLLSHNEMPVLLLFVVFLNGIFCSTSLTLHLQYKLLNKYLKCFKMLDKLYDNWSNNTLNLSATQGRHPVNENEGKHSCCPVLSQGYNCIVM